MHTCVTCGATKEWWHNRAPHGNCKDCQRAAKKPTVYDRTYHRVNNLKKKYGLTVEQWAELLEACSHRCVVCEKPFSSTRLPCADHDHVTGLLRGVICGPCNLAIGYAHDDVGWFTRVSSYLTSPPATLIIGEHFVPGSIGEHRARQG